MTRIYVPADYPTIQAAVSAASDHDVIILSPGVYAEDNLDLGVVDFLTIRGDYTGEVKIVTTTTIDLSSGGAHCLRGLTIESSVAGPTYVFSNVGEVTLIDCIITMDGCGGLVVSGEYFLHRCRVSGTMASSAGILRGGYGGTSIVTSSIFTNISAPALDGDVAQIEGATVTHCLFNQIDAYQEGFFSSCPLVAACIFKGIYPQTERMAATTFRECVTFDAPAISGTPINCLENVDPLLASDFSLLEGSPCIGIGGTNGELTARTDYRRMPLSTAKNDVGPIQRHAGSQYLCRHYVDINPTSNIQVRVGDSGDYIDALPMVGTYASPYEVALAVELGIGDAVGHDVVCFTWGPNNRYRAKRFQSSGNHRLLIISGTAAALFGTYNDLIGDTGA